MFTRRPSVFLARMIRACWLLPLALPLAGVPDALAADADGDTPVKVGQWERFEHALTNDKRYGDPYRDVTLNVTYQRPDGTMVAFWGFHDGGQTWRIRFMPDQLGTWRYRAAFSDGSGETRGAFECVASQTPGLIGAYEKNPIWFGHKGGDAVLIRGLHVGDRFFAANWPDDDRRAFLDWAQEQQYNLLSIASHYLNRDAPTRGRDWRTPRLWPLDAAEYAKMEVILDDLAQRRILIFPFGGFFARQSNYPMRPADQELYIRYTLARLGAYWNVLFNVAGPEPNVRQPWMAQDEVVRLGRLIRKHDPFGHALAVHNSSGKEPYKDSDWTTYGVLQGPKTLLAQETLWSGNENHPRYSDADLRRNAFVIHMCAASLVFADNSGNSSSGFSGSMAPADRKQKRHDVIRAVWDFFETTDFAGMTPRPDLVDRGHCLAAPGRQYLVYLDEPATVNVKVDKGEYRVQWINARDTSDRRDAGTTTDGRELVPPDNGGDWLVQLDSGKAIPRPGENCRPCSGESP